MLKSYFQQDIDAPHSHTTEFPLLRLLQFLRDLTSTNIIIMINLLY